ncbi:MAG: AraC family transcriptional regulator [Clostridia bacterium]|nr:AraC family transcriptional regulator [Clostridia bacterium]
MTVKEAAAALQLSLLCGDDSREITGVYVGDLLSRCMSRVEEGDLWITIMANINAVAVAALTDPALIVFCEDVEIGDDVLAKASENGIAIARSAQDAYALCVAYASIGGAAS